MTTIFTTDGRKIGSDGIPEGGKPWGTVFYTDTDGSKRFRHNMGKTHTPTLESVTRRLEPVADDLVQVVSNLQEALRFNAEARIGNALDQLIHDSAKEGLSKKLVRANSLLNIINNL